MKKKPITAAKEMAKSLPNSLVLEVDVRQIYIFDESITCQFKNNRQLIKEWFRKFPMSRYHASREVSKLGGADQVIRVKIVK